MTASDERLADYVRLRDTSLRRHLESEHGLFIAEGEKVIRRAVEAGYRPRSFLLAERWLPGLHRRSPAGWPEVPVYVVDRGPGRGGDRLPRPPRRPRLAAPGGPAHRRRPAADAERLVVIEDVVDHTNVGAVLRNAAASAGTGRCWRRGRPTRSTAGRSR